MTDRLKLYNGALQICGERALASLTVNEEGRRLLDDQWNDGAVNYCLQQGQWRFATRAAKFHYDNTITPDFGFPRVFAKPTDWQATCAVCSDEFFRVPMTRYSDEIGYWYADIDDIYIKYISNDANYGTNYANWPASFTEYVKTYLAGKIVLKLTNDESKERKINAPKGGLLQISKVTAINNDAQGDPPKFPAQGSWSRSRQGGRARGPMRDGGNTGNLIG